MGSPWGVAVGGLLLAVLALEWALVRARVPLYYRLGLPLALEPIPIDEPPPEEGETPTVSWRLEGEVVQFGATDGGLPGLHGVVGLLRERGRIRLLVRWAPPWSLFAVALGLGGLGAIAGHGVASVPLSVALIVAVLLLYQQAAVRAAAELRFHWSQEEG